MNGPDDAAAREQVDVPREQLDILVEQFLQRRRGGSAVTVDAFASEHEAHAAQLRELLPALLALEQCKEARTPSGSAKGRAAVPPLERLGDFRIVREIGRGGMGVVFEAVQESLARRVALKVLPPSALLTEQQLERFRREAAIAAKLHHTNIVPVFGSGNSDGHHWYAMQFIAGTGLDRWRDEQQQAPPAGSGAWRNRARFVARLLVQAAGALHYAHGQGTLHRDVKPANLLLEANEQLWVTDFGLAKALEAEGLTQAGEVLGTLQYMAPEQFAGSYDARSEVYALGVTLYELLALRPAFAGRSRGELMERIRAHTLEPLRTVCPDVPLDLAVIVERATARDPADRYVDAGALQRDLQAFLDDRAIAARRLSPAARLLRWCRRNRGTAAFAASTLLALAGAAVTGWVGYAFAQKESARAETNLGLAETNLALALAGFGEVFDALVGRDPLLAFDEDPDTGEQTVITRAVADPATVELLQKMLGFYEKFAAQNEGNQALRVETARAYRRVGAIHVQLENLDAAQQAYEDALERLATVTDRDVRFERAQVHWLLAVLTDPLRPPAGDRERARGPRAARTSRQHLQQALELVTGRLAAEPDNRELRALQARCLLLDSRLRDGGGPDGRQRRDEQRRQGITILRELVAAHPGAEQLRFELVDALVAPRPRGDAEPDVAVAKEARLHAGVLVEQHPATVAYQAVLVRAATGLARSLREQMGTAPAADKPGLRAAGIAELETAVVTGTAVLAAGGGADPRFVRAFVEARRALASSYMGERRPADAVKELHALVELIESQVRVHRQPLGWPEEIDRVEKVLEAAGRARGVDEARVDELKRRVQALRSALPPQPMRPDRRRPEPPPPERKDR